MTTRTQRTGFARLGATPRLVLHRAFLGATLLGATVLVATPAATAQDERDPYVDIVPANPDLDLTGVVVADPAIESVPCDAVCQEILANPAGWADSDGDGLTDADETLYAANPALPDTDSDGILDGDEIHLYNTFPWSSDSDQDLISDSQELFETGTNPRAADSDGDGYSDYEELYSYATNPNDYESYPASQGRRQ